MRLPFHADALRRVAASSNAPVYVLLEHPGEKKRKKHIEIDIEKLGRVGELELEDVNAALGQFGQAIYFWRRPVLATKAACRAACDLVNALGLQTDRFLPKNITDMAVGLGGSSAEMAQGLVWLSNGRRHELPECYSSVEHKLATILWKNEDADFLSYLPDDLAIDVQSHAISYGRLASISLRMELAKEREHGLSYHTQASLMNSVVPSSWRNHPSSSTRHRAHTWWPFFLQLRAHALHMMACPHGTQTAKGERERGGRG